MGIGVLPEESKPAILKEESPKEEKVEEEKDEEKVEKKDEKKVEKEVEKKVSPKVALMNLARSKRGKVTDKENTPKIEKEAVSVKEGTPKTPLIKASKLGTPKLG